MTSLTTSGEKRSLPQAATTTATTTFAPAPKRPRGTPPSINSSSSGELLRCKRRIHFGYALPQPAAVARRNERERNRVRMVNMGFQTLKQHVPKGANNKKMSKVETLKSAVEYIKHLQELLGSEVQHRDENRSGGVACYPEVKSERGYVVGQSPDCSGASSPSPSLASDASSPYDNFSPEEEDILQDFAAWFS